MKKTLKEIFTAPPEIVAKSMQDAVDDFNNLNATFETRKNLPTFAKLALYYFNDNLKTMELEDITHVITVTDLIDNYVDLFAKKYGQVTSNQVENRACIAYRELYLKYGKNT